MNSESMLHWFLLITACDIIAALFVLSIERTWSFYRNRALDIGCDYCEEPKPLNRTPDKSGYLCRKCMEAFFVAHEGEFTEEQMTKARKVYRRLKRKKR